MVCGVFLGFWYSDYVLSAEAISRIAVFSLAFFNILFFVVQPRLAGASVVEGKRRNPYHEFWIVISERPVIAALLFVQLWGTSRVLASVIMLLRTYNSDYVRGMHNPESINFRLIAGSVVMAFVGLVWLLGAVGVWQTHKWAWWLSLCLNGLASATTITLQLFKRDQFLVDVLSTGAVLLLLLPSTRRIFSLSEKNCPRTEQTK
jgi:hypothetical protein